jgi:hypothetical protein
MEDFAAAVSALSIAQFMQLVEEVRITAFTYDAWSQPMSDVDFCTMCRLLQEVELFLTV